MMSNPTRFRLTEAAAIRKHLLGVPVALIEHLVQQGRQHNLYGTQWLYYADLVGLDARLQSHAQRLLGMYVRINNEGTITDIGMHRRIQ